VEVSEAPIRPHTPAPFPLGLPMALDGNVLSSLSATLDDLIERLGELGDASSEDDEALVELREVERQLQTSSRRLAKIVRRVSHYR